MTFYLCLKEFTKCKKSHFFESFSKFPRKSLSQKLEEEVKLYFYF
jgi:hypothetical protein